MLCFILAFLAVPKVKFFFAPVNSFFGCCTKCPKYVTKSVHRIRQPVVFLNRRKRKTTVLHSHAGHPTFSGVIKMITNVVYLFRKISMKNRVSYTGFKIRKDFTGFSALPRIILRCLMMHAAVK